MTVIDASQVLGNWHAGRDRKAKAAKPTPATPARPGRRGAALAYTWGDLARVIELASRPRAKKKDQP